MSGPALRIKGLKSALAGPFDLAVEAGGCVGITGASGSGKSLFLRMIADLDPNQGEVWLADAARSAMPAPAWRRQVIYVPADFGWWSDHIIAHIKPEHRDAAKALARRLGLPDGLMDGLVARLSTGERQRMAIIRALVIQPKALLLDEPTSGLDEDGALAVEAILRERMAGGAAVVVVTHSPAQAKRMASQRFEMKAGHLEAIA